MVDALTFAVMRDVVERGFERLAAVEDRYLAVAFSLLLLTYTVALIVEALEYNANARLFPLIVGVPLALLIVANIGMLFLADRFDLRLVGLFDDVGDFELPTAAEPIDQVRRYRREVAMVLWILFLLGLIWLFGNYVAIAVFLFTFIVVHEHALGRAALTTLVTLVFVYLLFDFILGARLWRGIIPLGGLLP